MRLIQGAEKPGQLFQHKLVLFMEFDGFSDVCLDVQTTSKCISINERYKKLL